MKFYCLYFVLDDHTECSYGNANRDFEKTKIIWGQVKQVLKKLTGNKKFVSTRSWKPYIRLLYHTFEDMLEDVEPCTKLRAIKLYEEFADGCILETRKIKFENGFTSIEELIKVLSTFLLFWCFISQNPKYSS